MTKTENTTTDTRAVLGVFGVRAAQAPEPTGYRSAPSLGPAAAR